MNEEFMNELEGAARVIMAAPNLVTNEERRKAEEILLNFRRTKTPIRTCRQILEKSNVDYLHFEAAEVIKRGIVREWNFVSFSDKEDLIQYLFRFVVTRDIPCFVRDKMLIAISIMVKRISADDNGKQRRTLLNQVEDLISTAEHSKKMMGCQFILILMQEYATTCKSSDLGLPWEVHTKCKKHFENSDLLRTFKFVMGLLKDITGMDTPFEPATAQFIKSLLQIVEQVLTWTHSAIVAPKRIVGQYESSRDVEDFPLLYFTVAWKDVMLAPELVPLMFMIYWKIRYSEELSHHALTCLIQLSSVTAKGVDTRKVYNEEARIAYVQRYLENYLKLISSVQITGKEALGISTIAKKLAFSYHYEIANGLILREQQTFLEEMTRLTCYFCEKYATVQCDEDVYEDSFRNMINAWCYLFLDFGKEPKVALMKNCSVQIFGKYVQSRIAPSPGFRRNTVNDDEIDNENLEDADRIKYKDQLQVIGIFGRYALDYSLEILYTLMERGTEQLKNLLQLMEVRPLTLEESTGLESIFEDLHWILLIAGHVLAMDCDGETPIIPTEVMAHSVKQMNVKSNLDATLETLAKSQDLHWVNNCIDQCDGVIRLLSNAIRLCVIEDSAASIKLGHFMSPLVSCSLMWFIKRFCMFYLAPMEGDYTTQLSPILIAALGKQTEGANYIITFLVKKVQNNIINFYTEPVLLQDTVDLFGDIVSVKNKSQHFMNAENIWSLIMMQNELKPGHFPPEIRRGLYRGFAKAASTFCQDPLTMTQYMENIFQPLQARFSTLLSNGKLAIHNELVQNELVDIIECLIGTAKGGGLRSAQDIFNNMCPILETMIGLLKTYYNYQVIVQSILELMSQSARYLVCYLKHDQTNRMFQGTIQFITIYANCHANRLSSETSDEDSITQDLSYILDILTYLLSKDYLDFCPTESPEDSVKASTFVMQGFCIIMPFVTRDLLKYPDLCLQYYRLLLHINDMCPKEIYDLDNDILVHTLQSIEVGLSQFGPEVTTTCLDFITRLGGYIFKHKMYQTRIYELLKPCIKVLLDLTISNEISAENLSNVGECLYLLICCYPKEYELCVQMLVQNQQDPMVSGRLSAAFDRLLAGIDFENERSVRLKFKHNFEKFIFHVQGFLLVK